MTDPLDDYEASLPTGQVVRMLPRLAWRRAFPDVPDNYVYREGHDFARLIHEPWVQREAKWQWFVSIDALPRALAEGGDEPTKQAAADRATEAWHRLRAQRG